MRLTTLGDLVLDVIVLLERPLVPGDDQAAVTRTCAGGQAANVAAWARELGAGARLVAKRGADAAGELLAHELGARGVELVGPVVGRTGVVVSLATGGDRTMASDRGVAGDLRVDELDAAWFDCDVLHVSGYALLAEPAASAAAAAVRAAHERSARVSVDLSTWSRADAAFAARVRALEPEIVFATERERDAVGDVCATWVVKRGAAGIVVDGTSYPAIPVDAVDTTGAGDALAAGFLVGGPEVGLAAAARCCAQVGAMP